MSGNIVRSSLVDAKPNWKAATVSFKVLEEAFGPSSLGILIVRDLPHQFVELRRSLLSYASYLANLPSDILDSLSLPEANFLTGWSHGKEALKDGSFDTHKGSFYVNCSDFYHRSDGLENRDRAQSKYPEFTASNVWPVEAILPGFRQCFEELCSLVIDIAALVAKACDDYAEANIEDYEPGYLERVVRTSTTTKARLLHYFPPEVSENIDQSRMNISTDGTNEIKEENLDSWCSTHIDHDCLTGLTSAAFIDESTHPPQGPSSQGPTSASSYSPLPFLQESPDPDSGLYIRSRLGTITKVSIPSDCLGFQTGESLQLITNGKFKAVPHFVRAGKIAANGSRIARNTLAVFTQPGLDEVVDRSSGKTYAQFSHEVSERFKG
ncbi:MAG: hypothetical protein Q9174_000517 [Haloplaca sp. 1 TL-2023]